MAGFSGLRAACAGMAALCLSGCAEWNLRAGLASGAAAVVLGEWDRDHDGALDRGEVTALVEVGFPPAERTGPGWDALRSWLVALWFEQDRDGDGKLRADELVRVPRIVPPENDGGPGF